MLYRHTRHRFRTPHTTATATTGDEDRLDSTNPSGVSDASRPLSRPSFTRSLDFWSRPNSPVCNYTHKRPSRRSPVTVGRVTPTGEGERRHDHGNDERAAGDSGIAAGLVAFFPPHRPPAKGKKKHRGHLPTGTCLADRGGAYGSRYAIGEMELRVFGVG